MTAPTRRLDTAAYALVLDDRFDGPDLDRATWCRTAERGPGWMRFFVDRELVRAVPQAPGYPLQLMLGIYEFRGDDGAPGPGEHPKVFGVERLRVWAPRS